MSAAVSREGLLSPEGLARAEQIAADAKEKRTAKPPEPPPWHPSQDYTQFMRPTDAPDAPRAPMSVKEIAKLVASTHKSYRAAIARGAMKEAQALLLERQRYEQSLQAAIALARQLAEDKASWEASAECAAAKQREEEERARQAEAEAEQKRQIAAHGEALGKLLVLVDDELRALMIRPLEDSPGGYVPPPPWLKDTETAQRAVFNAAADFFAAATTGQRGLAFAGARVGKLSAAMRGRFLETSSL